MEITVLRDFATATQRFAAGQAIAADLLPAQQRAALAEAGYLPRAEPAKPAKAAPPAAEPAA